MAQQTQTQFAQTVSLVQKHKDKIRNILGPVTAGTSFDPSKSRFTSTDETRLQNEMGLSSDDVQSILQVWPVYQIGYEDGQNSSR